MSRNTFVILMVYKKQELDIQVEYTIPIQLMKMSVLVTTEHAEVILLKFDKKIISYTEIIRTLLEIDMIQRSLIDRGYDVGRQYRSAIFFL